MRLKHLLPLSFLLATTLTSAPVAGNDAYQEAMAAPNRPAADRARDAGRKPAEVLAFFEVAPRQRVLDLASGSGYFTELLSLVVGPEGSVIAHNPPFFLRFPDTAKQLMERYGSGRLENVALLVGGTQIADFADNSFDTVFFVDTYHDVAYDAATGEKQSALAAQILGEIRRLLKPGGILAVIDHAAVEGSSRAEAAKLHRVLETMLKADMAAAGFMLEASADFLRDGADDHSKAWFSDPALRDRTDRFVHRYRSPD